MKKQFTSQLKSMNVLIEMDTFEQLKVKASELGAETRGRVVTVSELVRQSIKWWLHDDEAQDSAYLEIKNEAK
jgi:hypothetical protein